MDQATVSAIAVLMGTGGVSGVLAQLAAMRKEKAASKKWRADMEARLSKLEDESPSTLLKRLEEVEEVREGDKRELYRVINGFRTALRATLDSLSEIQARLKIPTV